MACIGGILMFVAVNMVKPAEVREVWNHNRFHAVLMVYTAVMVPVTDFLIGVLSALVLYGVLYRWLDTPMANARTLRSGPAGEPADHHAARDRRNRWKRSGSVVMRCPPAATSSPTEVGVSRSHRHSCESLASTARRTCLVSERRRQHCCRAAFCARLAGCSGRTAGTVVASRSHRTGCAVYAVHSLTNSIYRRCPCAHDESTRVGTSTLGIDSRRSETGGRHGCRTYPLRAAASLSRIVRDRAALPAVRRSRRPVSRGAKLGSLRSLEDAASTGGSERSRAPVVESTLALRAGQENCTCAAEPGCRRPANCPRIQPTSWTMSSVGWMRWKNRRPSRRKKENADKPATKRLRRPERRVGRHVGREVDRQARRPRAARLHQLGRRHDPQVPAFNYFEFRRLRLMADGVGYGVYDFRIQIDIEPESGDGTDRPVTDIKDAYFTMHELPSPLDRWRIGNFFVPFSLEQVTNDTNNIFLERSIPTQGIFAADREVGMAVLRRATTPRILPGRSARSSTASANRSRSASTTTRASASAAGSRTLPYYDEPSNGRYLVHTGVGVLYTNDQDELAPIPRPAADSRRAVPDRQRRACRPASTRPATSNSPPSGGRSRCRAKRFSRA